MLRADAKLTSGLDLQIAPLVYPMLQMEMKRSFRHQCYPPYQVRQVQGRLRYRCRHLFKAVQHQVVAALMGSRVRLAPRQVVVQLLLPQVYRPLVHLRRRLL